MSDGGAQHKVYGPYWDALNATMYQSIWIQTFNAGAYSVAKDFWTNEDKNVTSPSNVVELQGGTNGTVAAYFDGDYAVKILASDKVTVIAQYPSVKLTSDTATMWEGNQTSGSYGAATAANVGQLKVKIAAGVLRGLALQQATSYVEFFTANAAGEQTIDTMVAKSYPWYDITHDDYGAVAGEASDQSVGIQAAIDAIETVGHGVLFIPEGRFQIDSSLDINNTSMTIMGMGSGKSVLVQTVDSGAAMLDYDTTDITDTFFINGVGLETEVAASSTAIDCAWPSTPSGDSLRNCALFDIYIGATAADSATAYFSNAIIVSDAKRMDVTNVFLQGHDTLDTTMVGLLLNGYTAFTSIINLRCHHMLTGLETTTNVINTKSTGCEFIGQTNGVLLGGCAVFGVSNTLFQKSSGSTVNWFGIKGDTADITISGGNTFKDSGGAGTDKGIYLDTTTRGTITGNNFNGGTVGVDLTANCSGVAINNNIFSSVTTQIANVNASNPVQNNYPIVWVDVASAQPLVGSNATNHWNITGTTNFNNIDSSHNYEGREVFMEFNAALTIAVAGNMKIPSTHTPTGPLDLAAFQYKGARSGWLEQYYSANQ